MAQEESNYRIEGRHDNIHNVASDRRLKILFDGQIPNWDETSLARFGNGDICFGQPASPQKIRRLEDHGYLSFDQQYNSAPTIGELVRSAEYINTLAPQTGECRLIGYAVSPKRADCRIIVEGARYNGPVTDTVRSGFIEEFGDGYEFSESSTHLRRWHD